VSARAARPSGAAAAFATGALPPGFFDITFDNKEIGRMQAAAAQKVMPKGRYLMIKGSPTDPYANFLREGQGEVLAAAIKSGAIKIVGARTRCWACSASGTTGRCRTNG
jgi:D-xylose transport system substrate-binding protein